MNGGEIAVMLLLPVLVVMGIAAYAAACTRYPRRSQKGARR